MRDRLIELISKSGCVETWNHYTDDYKEPNPIDELADYLLANGVIVPPCKVGDILYLPIEHRVIAYEVSKIKYDGDLLKIVTHNKLSGLQRTIWAMDVGATIFLSREEAEKALERSRG